MKQRQNYLEQTQSFDVKIAERMTEFKQKWRENALMHSDHVHGYV